VKPFQSRVRRHGLAITWAAAFWSIAIAAFDFARPLWLALLFLAAAGASDIGPSLGNAEAGLAARQR
jgi:hypothetical protein